MESNTFVWPEFNKVIQEFIDTKFANFAEDLVTAFSRYDKTCKMHIFPMRIIEGFLFSAGYPSLLASFHCLMIENHLKSCCLLLFSSNSHYNGKTFFYLQIL